MSAAPSVAPGADAAPAFDQLPDSILMKLGTYLNSATQARFGQAMGQAGAAMCLGVRQKSTMERHDAHFGEVRPATGRESVGSLAEVMRDTAPLLAEFNAREAAKAVPSGPLSCQNGQNAGAPGSCQNGQLVQN